MHECVQHVSLGKVGRIDVVRDTYLPKKQDFNVQAGSWNKCEDQLKFKI